MKIGYFTSIEGWGGSEMYLLRLMLGVRDHGHEVLLFGVAGTRLWEDAGEAGIPRVAWRSIRSTALDHMEEKSKLNDTKTQRAAAPSQRTKVYGLRSSLKHSALEFIPGWLKLLVGNAREVIYLHKVFRGHSVDVMHVNVHGYEVAGIASRLIGVPCVGVYCISVLPKQDFLRDVFQRWTSKAYDVIVGKSQYCLDGWLKATGIAKHRGICVYNGIEKQNISEKKPVIGPKPVRRVLSVGRLHPMKGYDLLIKAFSGLSASVDIELVIAGDGPQRLELERLIQDLHLENRVSLLGHVEDVPLLLQKADLFVLPSVSHESFGQSVIEAMATGIPVITSDFGPFPEINLSGKTGLVVQAGSSNALKDALIWCCLHPAAVRDMGMQARKHIARYFLHDETVNKMVFLYEQLRNQGNG